MSLAVRYAFLGLGVGNPIGMLNNIYISDVDRPCVCGGKQWLISTAQLWPKLLLLPIAWLIVLEGKIARESDCYLYKYMQRKVVRSPDRRVIIEEIRVNGDINWIIWMVVVFGTWSLSPTIHVELKVVSRIESRSHRSPPCHTVRDHWPWRGRELESLLGATTELTIVKVTVCWSL